MLFLIPSRGRPDNARRLIEAFAKTKVRPDTGLLLIVDQDDPQLSAYRDVALDTRYDEWAWLGLYEGPRRGLVGSLNHTALMYARSDNDLSATHIGFMGDDHVPVTGGWDVEFHNRLSERPLRIVYGNDLLQAQRLPTAVALDSRIVRELGYMAPPTLRHLYVDNFWSDLGHALGTLVYLPEIIIEHRHPLAQKATWDDGYAAVNSGEMYQHDHDAYEAYRAVNFARDVDLLLMTGLLREDED